MEELIQYINGTENHITTWIALIIAIILCIALIIINIAEGYGIGPMGILFIAFTLISATILVSDIRSYIRTPQQVLSDYTTMSSENKLIMELRDTSTIKGFINGELSGKSLMEFDVFQNETKQEHEQGYIVMKTNDKESKLFKLTKSEFEHIKSELHIEGLKPVRLTERG